MYSVGKRRDLEHSRGEGHVGEMRIDASGRVAADPAAMGPALWAIVLWAQATIGFWLHVDRAVGGGGHDRAVDLDHGAGAATGS